MPAFIHLIETNLENIAPNFHKIPLNSDQRSILREKTTLLQSKRFTYERFLFISGLDKQEPSLEFDDNP